MNNDRKNRLGDALRANLRKRKDQMRQRSVVQMPPQKVDQDDGAKKGALIDNDCDVNHKTDEKDDDQ